MRSDQWRAVAFGAAVQLARFGVILLALGLAPLLGIQGWYLGLAVNTACVVFAIVLVTVRGLWRKSGLWTLWKGPVALLLLVPLVCEAVSWAVPAGLNDRAPGFGLWALTLLMVGINEELTNRVVVLERMRASFSPYAAAGITAALFGLQHLSAFATGSRSATDILTNVAASACYGFALAAFQYRFQWVLPLIILHAAADFTTTLSIRLLSDGAIVRTSVMFVGLGMCILALPKNCVRRISVTGSRPSNPS